MQPVRSGPAPPKYGSGTVLPGVFVAVGPEEHADRRRHERVADTHVVGDLFHHLVGIGERRVLDHAEHALRLVVMGHQLRTPVGDVLPLRVVEERVRRHVERVGVVQRSSADARACQDHDVAQKMDPLDAVHAEFRHPQELAQVPRGLGEVLVGETPSGLQDADPVALFGEPQRADASPEPRTNNQNVIVRLHRLSMNLPGSNF